MNKYFVVALLALCAASASAGRIVREAPVATPSPLAQLFGGFEDTFSKLHTSFLDLWGAEDNSALFKMVETQSTTYAGKLQTIVGQLTDEAKKNSGAFDGVVAEIKTKITDTIKDIETKNPELMADSKKYQEQFETQMRGIMSETEKFREKLKGEGGEVMERFEKVAKELYETTLTTATTYSKQVENTLKETKA